MSLKLKDYIVPVFLAFTITLLCQYFFFDTPATKTDQPESGRSHTAPRMPEVHRPLDLEINFVDVKPSAEAQKTVIETDYARYVFSTDGAALEQIEYKHTSNNKEILLKTTNLQTNEDKSLLVVFPNKTPFYYQLVDKQENDQSVILTYKAEFDSGFITKKFVVFKHESQIDLEISFVPSVPLTDPIRLRVVYQSPYMENLKEDLIQGVMNEGTSIQKKPMTTLLQRYWEIPTLFGFEDRYFIQSMTKDVNNFTQRGYYKASGVNTFAAILEGPAVKEKSSWLISFYFGPKKIKTIATVDPRLERTLDYGYLGIIAKPLLSMLNFFYSYFGNYGIAIILLTLLIKLFLLPFTLKGEQSMKKREEFQRKLQYIQQKYKDDKEALANARAELIKKHGMPDAAGCLPLLLQLPIFFALNRILSTAIELYMAPFLWIPNLSAPDPYSILSILIGLSIILYSTASDTRQRMTSYAMALLLAAFSSGLPAGLSLFIFMSSILAVAQTKLYGLFKKA